MYSYEDRIRAVKLYIKLGKCTGATLRQLGYPTKNALKSWHREFEQGRDLPLGYALSRSKYSNEQKKVAVEHYLSHDRFLAGTRKALGYPCRDTLAAWVNELHPEVGGQDTGGEGVGHYQCRVLTSFDSFCCLLSWYFGTRPLEFLTITSFGKDIQVPRPHARPPRPANA